MNYLSRRGSGFGVAAFFCVLFFSLSPVAAEQPAADGGSISPMGKREPLAPRAFTLEDRYLDAIRRGNAAEADRAVELGADAAAVDSFGRNALLLAARDAGSLELVKAAKARGLAHDDADIGGRTALSWAAGAGRVEIVAFLLDAGANPDSADRGKRTPLMYAARAGRVDVAAALLDAGASVDAADDFGDTPLIAACAKAKEAMAKMLIERGADRSLEDREGRNAAERARPGAPSCSGR